MLTTWTIHVKTRTGHYTAEEKSYIRSSQGYHSYVTVWSTAGGTVGGGKSPPSLLTHGKVFRLRCDQALGGMDAGSCSSCRPSHRATAPILHVLQGPAVVRRVPTVVTWERSSRNFACISGHGVSSKVLPTVLDSWRRERGNRLDE